MLVIYPKILNAHLITILLGCCFFLTACGESSETGDAVASATESTTAALSKQTAQESQIIKQNTVPIHTTANAAAMAKIPSNYHFLNPGYFTVAVHVTTPPLTSLALDNQTVIGAEVDIARLIADSLGLQLKLVPTSWEDWPLGIQAGRYDAAMINIAVTKARKEKYDFATYRTDVLAFYIQPERQDIHEIKSAKDISGLKIVVGAGTNQEKLLLQWNEQLIKQGLAPAQPVYLQDTSAAQLALQSQRVDALLIPDSLGLWNLRNGSNIKRVGYITATGKDKADVAVTVKKGSGLIDAVQEALQGTIQNGHYEKVLTRWGLGDVGVTTSQINPKGFDE
ncbi:ABC transporter substrate-binding protein [Acinetobacter larvae]|uniref:Solute-binding protein family 3/N-terminal domain-containing protein n=1 Tax=Acinetobacter larvae TaxID=1789224 RepID=A0A1B2M1S9_9GAMM|nr:ABC transporter substrate-binding protein [Acinetobacter larvae]AOA59119.1 hypothetical protein BFG52_12655 [Acinetobacter larvae]